VAALGTTHDIEVITSRAGHDDLTGDRHHPFDLMVFDIDQTPIDKGLLSALRRHGGVLRPRTLARPDIGTLVSAARITVVHSHAAAEDLRACCHAREIQLAAVGVPASRGSSRQQRREPTPVLFGTLTPSRTDVVRRALDRAGLGDNTAVLLSALAPEDVLAQADVVISIRWPWAGEPDTAALAGMAAGKPVVVLETQGTADWPALNPQTWQPRGPTPAAPIVVSVDPLDEEHSLALAFGRLATDPALRLALATAAHNWWHDHATPQHAAADWERILREAASPATPASGAR
jgi:hypothetical protein